MKLPNAQNATVDERKVRDYLLSASHPVGRFKAKFFGTIGFPPEAWPEFMDALVRLAAEGEAKVVEDSKYGRKFSPRSNLGRWCTAGGGRISVDCLGRG